MLARLSRIPPILLFGFGTVMVAGAQSNALTVDEAVRLALNGNRLIKIAVQEQTKSRSAALALRKRLLPVVSLNIDTGQLLESTTFRIPKGSLGTVPGLGEFPVSDANIKSGTNWTTLGALTIAQPITQIPRIRLGVRIADEQTAVSGEQLRQKVQEITEDVRATCYHYLQAEAGLKAATSAVLYGNEAVRAASEAAANGALLDQVVLEAKAKLSAAEQQVVELNDSVESARMRLNQLLARDLFTPIDITTPEGLAAALPTREDARATAARYRPEVAQAERKLTMAGMAVQLRRREDDPDVSVVLTAARPVGVDYLPDPVLMLGFRMTWAPIDWGRRKIELTAKSAEAEQARLAVEEARQLVALDADVKYRAVLRQKAALETANAEYEAAKEKVRVVHARLTVGSALPKDALEADYLLATAEAKRTAAQCDLAIAQSALNRAMGKD